MMQDPKSQNETVKVKLIEVNKSIVDKSKEMLALQEKHQQLINEVLKLQGQKELLESLDKTSSV